MAVLKMVRVDYRLIHGQVVAKWVKFHPVDRIVLVDDALVEDDFMADIYRMAVGDKKVDIVGIDAVSGALESTKDEVMLIFKDVESAYRSFQSGLSLDCLNVGAVQNAAGRKTVLQGVALSKKECDQLMEMEAAGVNVFMQPIPEHDAVSLASAASKVR